MISYADCGYCNKRKHAVDRAKTRNTQVYYLSNRLNNEKEKFRSRRQQNESN